jgi:hypothetical protein
MNACCAQISRWWRYSWENVAYIIGAAIVLTILRYQYQRFFANVGRKLQLKDPVKYSESTWKLFFYMSSTLWGLYILWVYEFEWVGADSCPCCGWCDRCGRC